ncbi:hypothetical protein [Halorussus caseinilyticus]|uniref:Uncharacterized protein n=1 Tax=Halorussus caseinilyticus TaxID=3034025 RepID=A0ABD5WT74_9EURY|nr:hypothetical protein [Halorussus sp. DT72]
MKPLRVVGVALLEVAEVERTPSLERVCQRLVRELLAEEFGVVVGHLRRREQSTWRCGSRSTHSATNCTASLRVPLAVASSGR